MTKVIDFKTDIQKVFEELAKQDYESLYMVLHTKDSGIKIVHYGSAMEMIASGHIMSQHGLQILEYGGDDV